MKLTGLQQLKGAQKLFSTRERELDGMARGALLAFALLFFAASAFAQTNALVDRLPADTWAYISWGGTASLQPVRATNSVLRLWSDPSFSRFLERSISTVSHQEGPTQKFGGLTPEQTAEIFSLVENPAVIGFVSNPESSRAAGEGSTSYFVIYDGTGKRDLIDKLQREHDAKATPPPRMSTISIAGTTVEKRVSGSNTSYESKVANYYVRAGSRHAMEELLARFGSGPAPTASFTQLQSFPAECREMARPSILNVLVLPAQFPTPRPSANPGFDFHAASSSLGLDRIRGGCLSVTFEKETTRIRSAVLGDTLQGSILNLFGDNLNSFATMSLAAPTSSFQVSNIDFVALYNSLFNAISAGLPGNKAPIVAAGVAFLTSTWGMPPDQAFGLFTGEIATIHPNVVVDPSQTLYAVTIHDSDKVLRILQHAMPGERVTTNQEGDVTYLAATMPLHAMSPDVSAAASATYFAVTPNMLLVSKEQRLLRDAVAHLPSAGDPARANGLAADPTFQKARASLPAKLVSLTYRNYANFNWRKAIADFEKSLGNQRDLAARNANKPAPPRADLLEGFDPALLSRYLHVFIGGAWKDSNGIYFDSHIQ